MRRTDPPFIATWMLEHLTPGNRNDALSGDLFEEFRSGRSVSWYWRQVLAAMATGYFSEIRAHSLVMVFAALWAIPARAWWSFAFWPAAHLVGLVLPWPDSTMIGMAILVFQSLWAGLVVYVFLSSFLIERNFSLERMGYGFWIGPLVFTVLTITIKVLSHPLGIARVVNAHEGTLKLVIYFFSLVVATWGVRFRVVPKSKAVTS